MAHRMRPSFFWYDIDFLDLFFLFFWEKIETFFFFEKSVSYQNKNGRGHHPSFGMTMTQAKEKGSLSD